MEAVDEALSSLGLSARQATYYYLDKVFNLKRQEIPLKINDFTIAIEKFFGLGANFLEDLILKQLGEKIGKDLKRDISRDLSFTERIAEVKQGYADLEQLEASV